MEYVIAIAVIAGLVWLFQKENARRGVKTVRAYLFMRALEEGKTIEQANQAAAEPDAENLPGRAIHNTMAHLQAHYRGRQRLLLKDAEKRGWRG